MMVSTNNKLILQPYKTDGKLRSNVQSGFAMVAQKTNLIGLIALADGLIGNGQTALEVEKGSKVYFKEETLHTSEWAKKTYESSDIGEPFIIAEGAHVISVETL